MMIRICSILILCFALWSAAWADGPAKEWNATGENDVEAAASLANFLLEHGVTVASTGGNLVTIKPGWQVRATQFLVLEPRLMKTGLDRLIIHTYFPVKDAMKTDKGLPEFATRLVKDFNVGSFYLDKDTDLAFRTQLTFVDTLSWDELLASFAWLQDSLEIVAQKNEKEFNRFLE